jgi:CubicO group peptidase (beta-lactamase class C family)
MDLDAEIQTYVPSFPRKEHPVTIRQLLGHLGGIPHYVDRAKEQHIREHKSTRESVAIFENFPLVAEPGTKWVYSSYGYNLLGAAIEGASKQPYAEYMRDHVWRPAGMVATQMDDPLALIPHRVRGYQLVDGEIRNSELIDVSSRFAAGGTRGTVPDLLRFMKALNEGKLLSPKSIDTMCTPMVTRGGRAHGLPGNGRVRDGLERHEAAVRPRLRQLRWPAGDAHVHPERPRKAFRGCVRDEPRERRGRAAVPATVRGDPRRAVRVREVRACRHAAAAGK